jgi:hypothetical protein
LPDVEDALFLRCAFFWQQARKMRAANGSYLSAGMLQQNREGAALAALLKAQNSPALMSSIQCWHFGGRFVIVCHMAKKSGGQLATADQIKQAIHIIRGAAGDVGRGFDEVV